MRLLYAVRSTTFVRIELHAQHHLSGGERSPRLVIRIQRQERPVTEIYHLRNDEESLEDVSSGIFPFALPLR